MSFDIFGRIESTEKNYGRLLFCAHCHTTEFKLNKSVHGNFFTANETYQEPKLPKHQKRLHVNAEIGISMRL